MTDLRAKPQDLCMSDASPFQQHYEYQTVARLPDVLNDQFFMPLRAQLYAGDEITLCRFDNLGGDSRRKRKLLEIATVRVVSAGPDATAVPLFVTTYSDLAAAPAAAPAKKAA